MNNKISRKINNNHNIKQIDNPIIYFFTYFYRWFFYFIYKIHNSFFPEKKIIILDPIVSYIENNKIKLLESFNNNSMNRNMEDIYYNIKDLEEALADQNNILEKLWRTRILFENSPRGNIIMYYDLYKRGFAYFSDINGIPYNILNAVAMKYVMTFMCRDFFMDNQFIEESPLIKLYLEKEKDDNNDKKGESLPKLDTSAFAKLKNYKLIENSKEGQDSVPEKQIIRNLFINLGRIGNFKFLQIPEKKNNLNGFNSKLLDGVSSECGLQKQVMNYSRYKELLMKKDN